MTKKIATVKPGDTVIRLTFEDDKVTYKAWAAAPFASALVVGAEAEVTFKEVPSKDPRYAADQFVETWGGVGASQKKSFGGGGGAKGWTPRPESETLSAIAQAALAAAVSITGPAATPEQKSLVVGTANSYFDAMIAMCQRGKGKLEPRAAAAPTVPASQQQQQPVEPHPNGKPKATVATQATPEGKLAFGHKPERWPIETALCDPPTDTQRSAVVALCNDHKVPEEAREPLRRIICKAYGIKPTPSKGSLMLFADWLRNAGAEAIDQAVTIAMDPPEEFASDQPDPETVETPDDPRAAYLWLAQQLGWPGHGDGPQCATAFMKVISRRVMNAAELTEADWLALYRFASQVRANPALEPMAFKTWKEQKAKEKQGVAV